MDFHPRKYSVLSATRACSSISHPYTLNGQVLERSKSIKYLGVDIQSDLSWKHHTDRITKKSNDILRFLHQNLKTTDKETKMNTYLNGQTQFGLLHNNMELPLERSSEENTQ